MSTAYVEYEGFKRRDCRRQTNFTPISCYIVDNIAYVAATVGFWHPENGTLFGVVLV